MSEEIPIQFKACGTCPFRKNPKVIGSREYLKDVFSLIFHGRLNHSCHRTDKDADGYVGGEKKQCLGILKVADNDAGEKNHKDFFSNWLDFFQFHKSEGKNANRD